MCEDKKTSKFSFEGFPGWKTGFEPATSGTTIQRSNQLSYNHHEFNARSLQSSLFKRWQSYFILVVQSK